MNDADARPVQMVTCKRCRVVFPRGQRGRMPKYCKDCGVTVDNARRRDALAAQRADLEAKRQIIASILDPLRDMLDASHIATAEAFLASLEPDAPVAMVHDRMPAGTATPYGSEDGYTSEFEDLRGELAALRDQSARHAWHAENPAWWDDH